MTLLEAVKALRHKVVNGVGLSYQKRDMTYADILRELNAIVTEFEDKEKSTE